MDAAPTLVLTCIGRYGRFCCPVPDVGMPIVRGHTKIYLRGLIPIKMGRWTWPSYGLASRQWVYSAWELHRYPSHTHLHSSRTSVVMGVLLRPAGLGHCACCNQQCDRVWERVSVSNTGRVEQPLRFYPSNSCRKSCPLETKTRMDVWTSTSSPSIWRITKRSYGWLSRAWTGTTMVGNVSLKKKTPLASAVFE